MKQVVIFYGQESKNADPVNFGEKRDSYINLFAELENLGAEVYICRGYNNYFGKDQFMCGWKYTGGSITQGKWTITADSVYDRSGLMIFPDSISANVLNQLTFKLLCANKWLSYVRYPDYFAKTYLVNTDNLEHYWEILSQTSTRLVLKPIDGMKGTLVEVMKNDQLDQAKGILQQNPNRRFILQNFLDSSAGIPGIVSGTHDIRVVYIGKELVWAHIRQPGKDKHTANVAQGGSLHEFEQLGLVPKELTAISNEIAADFSEEFNNPLFSIDMCITPSGAKIYEFNDQIGFPRNNSHYLKNFTTKLATRILAEK